MNNTDAEGRLTLADALLYCQQQGVTQEGLKDRCGWLGGGGYRDPDGRLYGGLGQGHYRRKARIDSWSK